MWIGAGLALLVSFGPTLAVMIGFTVVLIPMLFAGMRLRRWEAATLLTGYALYVLTLFV